MFELKHYQKAALDAVEKFLTECAEGKTVDKVFQEFCEENGYDRRTKYLDTFASSPCFCIRVPTGGGKTVIAAASIGRIDSAYTKTGAPVVLWLTPSDAITDQTLNSLNDPTHPYRQSINKSFSSVKVTDVKGVPTVLQDFGKSCVVIVSTIQTFNVADTKLRLVYGFNEELQPFFANLSDNQKKGLERVTESDFEENVATVLNKRNVGDIKYSLANLLRLFRPIVVVDEAHNNRTQKFFETLNRLDPSVVMELTATPLAGKNNVIYEVSAWELKAEDMIKLPVMLAEFSNGWETCIAASVSTRQGLEADAAQENDYIRPILLIQAQPKGSQPSPEEVKKYLMDSLKVPETQIAIATGTEKELTGIDLFSSQCSIRYVITIKALKEGWDCPFAYVLCSLQNIHSAKDVEQLLGRVLRMPYAHRRSVESLNKAYANVVSEQLMTAAALIKDRLVEMGFNKLEANAMITPETPKPPEPGVEPGGQEVLPGCDLLPVQPKASSIKPITISIATSNDLPAAISNAGLSGQVKIAHETYGGLKVLQVDPSAEPDKLRQLTNAINVGQGKDSQTINENALSGLFATIARDSAEKNQQTPFPEMPMLSYVDDTGEIRLIDEEALLDQPWNPLKFPLDLDFNLTKRLTVYSIDVNQYHKIDSERTEDQVLPFADIDILTDEEPLIRWIVDQVRRSDVTPNVMRKFVQTLISTNLIAEKGFSLTTLYNHKVDLVRSIKGLLRKDYDRAIAKGFQRCLDLVAPIPEILPSMLTYKFDPARYAPRRVYDPAEGGKTFHKHMCSEIHDLRAKTSNGEPAEEFECACAIEDNPYVTRWIRNIERNDYSFWLPTVTGRFFPDFIAELTNGSILVVEYKGENLLTNQDTLAKKRVGEKWEEMSDGNGFFLLAVKQNDCGNVAAQIQMKINQILSIS